jgi:hypothetical protein
MFSADAWTYRAAGLAVEGEILNFNFIHILSAVLRSQEDWGFPVYIGFLYTYVYKSIATVLILNIVIGSYTVVLLAKIANLLYSRKHAVMTGCIAMLMPALMWYGGMYLKETVMIFLIVLVIYHAIKLVQTRKINIISIAVIVMIVPSLYYFRAAVSVLLFLSLVIYFVMNFTFKSRSREVAFVGIAFLAVGITYISFNMGQFETINRYYNEIGQASEKRLGAKTGMVGNVNIATGIATPLVAANAFFAPYPSFTNYDERQIGVISHAHIEVVRILMYYFGVLGLVILARRDLVKSSLILSFGAGYILILALTGMAMFSRFHLPAVPFIIIFSAVGFLDSSRKWYTRYGTYLLGAWCVVIMWHVFKAAIRGMV